MSGPAEVTIEEIDEEAERVARQIGIAADNRRVLDDRLERLHGQLRVLNRWKRQLERKAQEV